jgi:hypothetical protein
VDSVRPTSFPGKTRPRALSFCQQLDGVNVEHASASLAFRPSSRATSARRSLRGERPPLSRAVGTGEFLRLVRPANKCLSETCRPKPRRRADGIERCKAERQSPFLPPLRAVTEMPDYPRPARAAGY